MTPFHAVRFYDSTEAIGRVVAAFIGGGLTHGEPALVIASEEHCASLRAHLQGAAFSVPELERSRQLLIVDAAATLSAIIVNDVPDAVRFAVVVGALIDEVSETHHGRPRVYDEMGEILWKTSQQPAAIRLETCWSRLLATRECSLLCGHGPNASDRTAQVLVDEHTHIVADNGVPHPLSLSTGAAGRANR